MVIIVVVEILDLKFVTWETSGRRLSELDNSRGYSFKQLCSSLDQVKEKWKRGNEGTIK